MAEAGAGRVGTVIGRYYAMDRDRRWERVQLAYDLLVHGRAEHTRRDAAPQAARGGLRARRDRRVHHAGAGRRGGADPARRTAVIAFNFRPDRMREITRALADPGFDEIDRGGAEPVERYATMTEYEEGWPYPVAFPPARPAITLPMVIAAHGGRQLHVAETEKYPHVTYFFGGGEEAAVARASGASSCRRPRDVPDLRPQARDERAARRPRRSSPPGARTRRRSGSSTSPTPTWSGTPG